MSPLAQLCVGTAVVTALLTSVIWIPIGLLAAAWLVTLLPAIL